MSEPFIATDIIGGIRNDKGDKLEIETKGDAIIIRIVTGDKTAEFPIQYAAREIFQKTLGEEVKKCVSHVSGLRAIASKIART